MHKALGRIDLPAEAVLPSILGFARMRGAEVEEAGATTTIRAAATVLRFEPAGEGLSVEVTGDERGDVDGICELMTSLVTASGHAAALHWAPRPAAGNRHPLAARVEGMAQISPSFRRLALTGDFSRFLAGGLHFRLLFGPEGAPPPALDSAGELVWPGGAEVWHRPPYTIRSLSPEGDRMEVDIFIHEGGRVTEWTEEVRPGDEIWLIGPGGRGVRPARWLGLVGDETALPVILRALEAAGPETTGEAHVLVPDAADAQPVPLRPGLSLTWHIRGEAPPLIDIFRAMVPPAEDRFVMFAGEREEAALAREHAKALGLGSGEYHAAAYWTEGWVPPAGQRQARRRPA